MTNRGRIERFVRDSLGCTCPTEVFSRIEDESLPATRYRPQIRRIAIGGRLLVYLVDDADESGSRAQLASIVREGIEERERLGMNRFRLVLATENPDRVASAASVRFDQLPERDDKAHLHVIPRSELP